MYSDCVNRHCVYYSVKTVWVTHMSDTYYAHWTVWVTHMSDTYYAHWTEHNGLHTYRMKCHYMPSKCCLVMAYFHEHNINVHSHTHSHTHTHTHTVILIHTSLRCMNMSSGWLTHSYACALVYMDLCYGPTHCMRSRSPQESNKGETNFDPRNNAHTACTPDLYPPLF